MDEELRALLLRPEPNVVKTNLLRLAREDPDGARRIAVDRMATSLWRAWGPVLRARGATVGLLREVCATAARELWLWVEGDRPYEQLLDTLIGRTIRRLPA